MDTTIRILKGLVAGIAIAVANFAPASAQTDKLDQLFADLLVSDAQTWEKIERDIWQEWSKSGSPAMDLLLDRGRNALEAGDWKTAIEHLTALTDHAPDFAEGWNARATAYFHAGLYGPSIEDIRKALSLNPRHFGALAGLAMILEHLGYSKDALKFYREVYAIHPHRPNLEDTIERLEKEVGGSDI